ncbi:MAG: 2OG-Fe dioxygenase family protein [Cocleimonas sp.]|nr:2OG-Fe dioxygenase family protein [Cocleimonas sp.]
MWHHTFQGLALDAVTFKDSWDDLPADNFLSDGGHYRYRRYAVFTWNKGLLSLLPHEPHYQSTYRNAMNGGIYRDFEPFKSSTLKNNLFKKIINQCINLIRFKQENQWRIQAHQFRIQANNDEVGRPTPEGIHKDGADFILIMLLQRKNIQGGINHIYTDNKQLQSSVTLENFGDAILLDDHKVWHGVSEIHALDNKQLGYRDVLVLTFHKN